MFGSKNDFFYQSPTVLRKARIDLVELLRIKGRSREEVQEYIEAYNYFIANPDKFDGATIVKDLVDVRTPTGYLDADAMLHDYEYIMGANRNLKLKWNSDYKYIKNMEKNGKGIRIPRFIILTIIGAVLVPYMYKKYKD